MTSDANKINISDPVGNFLLLPQYANDLTKHSTEGSHWVPIPSRFVTFKLDDKPKLVKQSLSDALDVYMMDVLTSDDIYEACAYHANKLYIHPTTKNTSHFICDINMQSYNEYNNVGYSEMYCYIGNDTKPYIWNNYGDERQEYPDIIKDLDDISSNFTKDEVSTKVEFDYILVLYDILDTSGDSNVVIKKNIPMGFYMTRGIVDDEYVGDPVTKFISNDEIYGNGSSYGVRICTRFVNGIPQEFVYKQGDNFGSVDALAGIGELLNEIGEINKSVISRTNFLKETLSVFKSKYNYFFNNISIDEIEKNWGIESDYEFEGGNETVSCGCSSIDIDEIEKNWGI